MRILNDAASLKCKHMGVVRNQASQNWVKIAQHSVLVDNDPERRDIDRCPNRTLSGIRPCLHTMKVTQGYSVFVRIDGHAVCLDSVTGMTDGTPPRNQYIVADPGQTFVAGAA